MSGYLKRSFLQASNGSAKPALLLWLLAVLLLSGGQCTASVAQPLAEARKALLDGNADQAAQELQNTLATDRSSGPAHLLLCRVWLSEGQTRDAIDECQAALANGLARDSAAQDWTGRALGHEAEHAGMVQGLKLALEVRTALETAVSLDPRSEAANVDLGEYYTAAPAIVGGGTEKALALAARIEGSLPAVSHRIRAMVAEKARDYATAEREFQAEASTGKTPGAMVDLAAFYDRRKETDKAAGVARETISADPEMDATVVEAAGILDDEHQTQLALSTIRAYLSHGDRSDAAPACRVHTVLGNMLARLGNKTEARAEYEESLRLASRYAPARKGLGAL